MTEQQLRNSYFYPKCKKRIKIRYLPIILLSSSLIFTVVFISKIFKDNEFFQNYNANNGGNPPVVNDIDTPALLNSNETDSPVYTANWSLVLVNKDNKIPKGYEIELTTLSNGQAVDKRIVDPLEKMLSAAQQEKVYISINSAYRTAETQQSILDNKTQEYVSQGYSFEDAKQLASNTVANVGTSEHELGLAVDLIAMDLISTNQSVYDWLYKNVHEFGFILRYPADKIDITGIAYEPWHYRYVGIEDAGKIHESGVCLEEYLQADS